MHEEVLRFCQPRIKNEKDRHESKEMRVVDRVEEVVLCLFASDLVIAFASLCDNILFQHYEGERSERYCNAVN